MFKMILIVSAIGGEPHMGVVEGNVFHNSFQRCTAIAEAVMAQAGAFGLNARCEVRAVDNEFQIAGVK